MHCPRMQAQISHDRSLPVCEAGKLGGGCVHSVRGSAMQGCVRAACTAWSVAFCRCPQHHYSLMQLLTPVPLESAHATYCDLKRLAAVEAGCIPNSVTWRGFTQIC